MLTIRGTPAVSDFRLARLLASLPVPPTAQVAVFLVSSALLTGVFSAGPSMAALLEVAEVLARDHPPEAIYVGLALSVCAGSSLFLTSASRPGPAPSAGKRPWPEMIPRPARFAGWPC